MAIKDLTALKASFLGGHFRKDILDALVDEIVALDGRLKAKGKEIDALDKKIDALEKRVEVLE